MYPIEYYTEVPWQDALGREQVPYPIGEAAARGLQHATHQPGSAVDNDDDASMAGDVLEMSDGHVATVAAARQMLDAMPDVRRLVDAPIPEQEIDWDAQSEPAAPPPSDFAADVDDKRSSSSSSSCFPEWHSVERRELYDGSSSESNEWRIKHPRR